MMVRMLRERKALTPHVVEDMLAGENPYETLLPNAVSNVTIVHGKEGAPIRAKDATTKKNLLMPLKVMTLCLRWVQRVLVKPMWQWPWRCVL